VKTLRISVILALALAAVPAGAERLELFGRFADGWRDAWSDRAPLPSQRHTVYSVDEDESGRPVLRADIRAANLGLVRPIEGDLTDRAILRWRWKVGEPLAGNTRERDRDGDDYAARILVVFERGAVPSRTRALSYVWAANEPVGAVFPNPYSGRVGTVVLRSSSGAGVGDESAAAGWRAEERDLLADYRRYFGRPPRELSAVAILVDTDDTGLSTTAWFADLELETGMPEVAR
jgi:hypothetical protein